MGLLAMSPGQKLGSSPDSSNSGRMRNPVSDDLYTALFILAVTGNNSLAVRVSAMFSVQHA
jgi:hypothetical protein